MRAPRLLVPILPSALLILLLALAGVAFDRRVYDTIGFPGICGIGPVRAASDEAVHAREVHHNGADGLDLPGSIEFLGSASEQASARPLRWDAPRGLSGSTLTVYVDTVTSANLTTLWLRGSTPAYAGRVTQKYYYTFKPGSTKTVVLTLTNTTTSIFVTATVTTKNVTTTHTASLVGASRTAGVSSVYHLVDSTSTVTVFATGLPPPNVTADNTNVVFADYTTTVPHIPLTYSTVRPTCIRSTVPGATVFNTFTETKTVTSSVFEDVTVTVDAAHPPSKI